LIDMAAVEEVITSELSRIASVTQADAPPPGMFIGQLLLHAGKLEPHDIERILLTQRQGAVRFGDAARSLGLVSEADIQHALSRQFQYAYSHTADPELSTELLSMYQPFSVQAEALRALRTQLLLRWFQEQNNKSLAVLSARRGEGCTTIAANLAVVFAQLGERTLLIDANLRQPRLHRLFGLRSDTGLSSLLAGRDSLAAVLTTIRSLPNLSILGSGPTPPNPQELLSRASFSGLMDRAAATHDVVIIDAPAVLNCADAQLVAARAGGCLIVTRRHQTRLEDMGRLKMALRPTGAVLLGTVIND
jgi:protein-tyrosine kinase